MKHFVADTHALLWHLFAPSRLGNKAQSVFAEVDSGKARIVIPAMVIAEALMVAEKGRIQGVSTLDLLPVLGEFQASANYRLAPLLPETVIRSHALLAIPEIFDRLIAAEAIEREVPLLTRDPVIRASGLVTVVWD